MTLAPTFCKKLFGCLRHPPAHTAPGVFCRYGSPFPGTRPERSEEVQSSELPDRDSHPSLQGIGVVAAKAIGQR